jgi:uncharacterized protein (TIGR02246 family)
MAMQREDEQMIQQVIDGWRDAWNRHDMSRMAALVSEDADFVNVWGMHWRGRAQIEREHAERHRTQFKDSVWTTRDVKLQFLRPDVALVHLLWQMPPAREGLFTWVMVKEHGGWRIRAAHNTNVGAPKPS